MNPLSELEIRIEGSVGAQHSSLISVDLFDCEADCSDTHLDGLMAKTAPVWAEISDPDRWLNEIRGGLDGYCPWRIRGVV